MMSQSGIVPFIHFDNKKTHWIDCKLGQNNIKNPALC